MGKFMRGLFCLPIVVLLLFPEAKAQEVILYDVSIAGFSIGEMVAKKNVAGQNIKYEISSEVSFWFFGSVSVDFHLLANYQANLLTGSVSRTKTNKGNFQSDVKWLNDKKHYKVDANSYKYKLDTIITRPFDFSSVKLYFEEPVHHREFLAENFGLPSSIKKVKDYYEVEVNGNKNKFYYINGKLDKAIMQSPIKNYVIKRKRP